MKTTKRFIAMAAALALTTCAAMPMASFAAASEGKVSFTDEAAGTHQYTAYRIFDGSASESGSKALGNPTWAGTGTGTYTFSGFIGELKEMTVFGGSGPDNDFIDVATVADLCDVLAGFGNNSAKAKAFAKYCAENASNYGFPSASSTVVEGKNIIALNQDGYYVVKESNFTPATPGTNTGAQTAYLLGVYDAGTGAELNIKTSVPSVEKKVKDINDSDATPALSALQDSADYDIGDKIPYTITATIGDGIANFDAYSIQFVDDMSKGLTLDTTSWTVKVKDGDGVETEIKNKFNAPTSAESSANTDGSVWTWAAQNIKTYTKGGESVELQPGDQIILTYEATLNENATAGSTGNPNTVKLKYDNNPNNCGNGTPAGETATDKNIVFTYKTVFNKVDENGNALAGADFKLEKQVNGNWVDVRELHSGSGAINPIKTKTGDTTFEFAGLDDGVYKLTETQTPAGYNTIDPIQFTITATHDLISDNPALTALTGTGANAFTMTANVSAGSLAKDIQNEKGSTLPTTGGMGTTLFILGGGCAAGLAGIYLVSKKRAKEDAE